MMYRTKKAKAEPKEKVMKRGLLRTRDGMEGLGVDDGKMDRSARAMRGVQMKKEGIRTDHRRGLCTLYLCCVVCP